MRVAVVTLVSHESKQVERVGGEGRICWLISFPKCFMARPAHVVLHLESFPLFLLFCTTISVSLFSSFTRQERKSIKKSKTIWILIARQVRSSAKKRASVVSCANMWPTRSLWASTRSHTHSLSLAVALSRAVSGTNDKQAKKKTKRNENETRNTNLLLYIYFVPLRNDVLCILRSIFVVQHTVKSAKKLIN